MKLKPFISLMMCAFWGLSVQAQTMTAVCDQTSTNSITRRYGENIVVYNRNQDSSVFNVITVIDGEFADLYTIELDTSVWVNDFEMLGDELYFCGTHRINIIGDKKVCIGKITFESDWQTTNQTVTFYDDPILCSYADMTDALRIVAYSVMGVKHIFFVADAVISTNQMPTRGIVELVIPAESTIIWNAYFSTDGVEYFNDIVVTDNYVITVAKKNGSSGIYMRRFNRHGNIQDTSAVIRQMNTLWIADMDCHSLTDPYITRTENDKVGIAFYGDHEGDRGLIIESINFAGTPTVTKNQIDVIPNYNINRQKIKDIRYDGFAKRYLIIQQNYRLPLAFDPIKPHAFILYSGEARLYSDAPSSTTKIIVQPTSNILYGIDYYSASVFVTSGKSGNNINNEIIFHKNNLTNETDCSTKTTGNTTLLSTGVVWESSSRISPTRTTPISPAYTTAIATVSQNILTINCPNN